MRYGLGTIPSAGPTRIGLERLLRPKPYGACAPRHIDNVFFSRANARAVAVTCGEGNGLPCSMALPESAAQVGLTGLGALGFSSIACSSWATEMNTMGLLLAETERLGINATAYQQAKRHYTDASSSWWWSDPFLPATCRVETDMARVLNAALRSLVSASGGDTGVAPPPTPEFEDGTSTWVKVAVIGGIAVVGVIGIAYFTGNLARLLK